MTVLTGLLMITFIGFATPTASASTTYHGTFHGGLGLNSGQGWLDDPPIPQGTYPLNASGIWNVSEGVNGVQVTGYFRVFTKGPSCTGLQPCPFMLPLTAGTPWTVVSDGVYRSTFQTPLVLFTFTLTRLPGTNAVTLHVVTEGCPHGWVEWNIDGTQTNG